MAIQFSITQGAFRRDPSAANVILRAGVCSGGTSNQCYQMDPGQDPVPSVGYGPLAEAGAQASRLGEAKQILLKVPATTAGTISSVTESPSGTGPTITVVGSTLDGLTTPFGAYDCKVKVTTAGVVGVARVAVALDGASYNYTYDVPAETAAAIIGTVDLNGITLADLNTLTFIATSDIGGPITCTFTTPSSVADIATQITAASASGTDEFAAEIVAGRYLRVYSLTTGATSTLSIGNGTANTILGFTNAASASGAASKETLPGTGLVITFPSSSAYVLDTVYSFTTTAPRHNASDLATALAAANADPDLQFGLLEVVQDAYDGTDLRSTVTALDAIVAGWEAQADKRFVPFFVGAGLDSSDQSIKDAMSGHAARYGTVAAGDIYTTAVAPMPSGIFRRSAARPLGIRLASKSLSEDPGFGGFGELPECFMKGPAGALARNENTASTKLGTSSGPGFTVIKAKQGLPHFVRGVTRAGQSSRFVDIGVQRMSAYAATIIFAALQRMENPTFDLNADGTMQESDAASLEESFEGDLRRLLVQAKHASAVRVVVDRAEKISQTRNFTVSWTVQTRGQGENITGTLSVVGELTITG